MELTEERKRKRLKGDKEEASSIAKKDIKQNLKKSIS
jgi:hypothetical protein